MPTLSLRLNKRLGSLLGAFMCSNPSPSGLCFVRLSKLRSSAVKSSFLLVMLHVKEASQPSKIFPTQAIYVMHLSMTM